jgi:hypothetical protein
LDVPPKNNPFPKEPTLSTTESSSQIHLVKGIILHNNPLTVLCPTLAKGIICSRGTGPAMRKKPYRPTLLVKNHANPNLQLWSCKGCKDEFLLRVTTKEPHEKPTNLISSKTIS